MYPMAVAGQSPVRATAGRSEPVVQPTCLVGDDDQVPRYPRDYSARHFRDDFVALSWLS